MVSIKRLFILCPIILIVLATIYLISTYPFPKTILKMQVDIVYRGPIYTEFSLIGKGDICSFVKTKYGSLKNRDIDSMFFVYTTSEVKREIVKSEHDKLMSLLDNLPSHDRLLSDSRFDINGNTDVTLKYNGYIYQIYYYDDDDEISNTIREIADLLCEYSSLTIKIEPD